MAKQSINLGSSANDGGGTTLRAGGDIVNDNFNELYTALGNGTALQISLGSPSTGDVLTYNGSIFTTATPSTLSNIELVFLIKNVLNFLPTILLYFSFVITICLFEL